MSAVMVSRPFGPCGAALGAGLGAITVGMGRQGAAESLARRLPLVGGGLRSAWS